MIIHARQVKVGEKNKTFHKDDPVVLAERFKDGLRNPKSGAKAFTENINPFGFCVRATNNGSMTQDSFYDWCLHFIKHLPEKQKENGQNLRPHILILDGHTSRWNKATMDLLLENKVFPFFLPSHTSVWTQPNDCGSNKRLHTCVEKAIKDMRRTSNKYCVTLFNIVICTAWEDFLDRERKDLLATKQNTTTSSWEFVGLYPFCPNPESWNNVLSMLGKLNGLMRKDNDGNEKELAQDYEIQVVEKFQPLTPTEKESIHEGTRGGMSELDAAFFHMNRMMETWRATRNYDDESDVPLPQNDQQRLSFKLLQIVKRKEAMKQLEKQYDEQAVMRKDKHQQYKEEITQILACMATKKSCPNQISSASEKSLIPTSDSQRHGNKEKK